MVPPSVTISAHLPAEAILDGITDDGKDEEQGAGTLTQSVAVAGVWQNLYMACSERSNYMMDRLIDFAAGAETAIDGQGSDGLPEGD